MDGIALDGTLSHSAATGRQVLRGHRADGTPLVIKQVPKSSIRLTSHLEQLKRERAALLALSSPFIVASFVPPPPSILATASCRAGTDAIAAPSVGWVGMQPRLWAGQ